jgi:hypothetical protein
MKTSISSGLATMATELICDRNTSRSIGRGMPHPNEFRYEYRGAAIIQRLRSHDEVATVLEKLANQAVLETGYSVRVEKLI